MNQKIKKVNSRYKKAAHQENMKIYFITNLLTYIKKEYQFN